MYRLTDTVRWDAQIRRKPQVRKRRGSVRHHRISQALADQAHPVVIADLRTRNMTRSAQGSREQSGPRGKQKSGLHRAIPDSS